MQIPRRNALYVHELSTVPRQADLSAVRRRRRDRLRRPQDAPRLLVDRDTPEIHAAAAIAGKVEVTATR